MWPHGEAVGNRSKKHYKPRRKPSKPLTYIPVSGTIVVLAPLSNIVVVGDILAGMTEDFWVHAAKLSWTMRGHTAGEGPLIVGIAHGDYSVTEIKENLDVDYTDPEDKINRERAGRLVRRVGQFHGLAAEEALADGEEILTKCKFVVGNSRSLDGFVMNRSGATLTTGTIIRFAGTVSGRWLY